MTSRVPEDLPEQWNVSQLRNSSLLHVFLCFYDFIFTGLVSILKSNVSLWVNFSED